MTEYFMLRISCFQILSAYARNEIISIQPTDLAEADIVLKTLYELIGKEHCCVGDRNCPRKAALLVHIENYMRAVNDFRTSVKTNWNFVLSENKEFTTKLQDKVKENVNIMRTSVTEFYEKKMEYEQNINTLREDFSNISGLLVASCHLLGAQEDCDESINVSGLTGEDGRFGNELEYVIDAWCVILFEVLCICDFILSYCRWQRFR